MKLTKQQRRHFRNELRDARHKVHQDTEDFTPLVFVLERLGFFLTGESNGLYRYEPSLRQLAQESPLFDLQHLSPTLAFQSQFKLLRHARNDAMHIGAMARHAAANAVAVSLLLEDALVAEYETIGDFMVTDPVCAESWHPIAFIRQKMLANSFSFLPARPRDSLESWVLVEDAELARFLRGASRKERTKRLAMSLKEVIAGDFISCSLAQCLPASTKISSISNSISQKPILVVGDNGPGELLGLITAFDLL